MTPPPSSPSASDSTDGKCHQWRRILQMPVLAFPFRLFFLSAAFGGALLVPLWMFLLTQGGMDSLALAPLHWHQHEMLGGFLNAAIAGFLLTAVCNWTGTRPVDGGALLALWLLWLAGRLAMMFGGFWPILASIVDLSFLPLLAWLAGTRIWHARQYRQLILMGVLAACWVLDLLFHLSGSPHYLQALVVLAAVLILIIGGRITPAFTRNWLQARGRDSAQVRTPSWATPVGLVLALAVAVLVALNIHGALLGGLALAAAAMVLLRLFGWAPWQIRDEPLLWILHLGHWWVVLGFVLLALAQWHWVAPTAWLHALGAGAMGTTIMGVMTRVAMGHTGRTMALPTGGIVLYALVLLAGVLRVVTALGWLPWGLGVGWSAGLWSLSFAGFLLLYWQVLTRSRVDGKPG